MAAISRITPNLWFDRDAEFAARFYVGIFKNSHVGAITRYGKVGQEVHHMEPGSVMTIEFELDGQPFMALNGGPAFKFNEAVSFQVDCYTQDEVDYYWEKLSEGGDESAQRCGWLKDRFGVSWQIVPVVLPQLLAEPDSPKTESVMRAMLQMKKLEIDELQQAYLKH
ncbi:MAG: VOC family protein [Armatimonas sp.]